MNAPQSLPFMAITGSQPCPPEVVAALHTRIVPPLVDRDATLQDRLVWLGDEIGRQVQQVRAADTRIAWTHFLCTTCLSPMLTGWPAQTSALFDRIESHCGLRPLALLQPYECTGWGYALRFAGAIAGLRYVVLSIVDADIHDAIAAGYEQNIGRIGFGVTTVAIVLNDPRAVPRCGGPYPNRAFSEFMHAVKAVRRERSGIQTFIPFLPEGFAGLAQRVLGPQTLGPNRHAVYGHTFGADPWIGLIEWLQADPPGADEAVALGAFAYDGYFALCEFSVSPTTRVALAAFAGLTAEGSV